MEQLEAWLQERGIAIVGQLATGSGQMVRLQLRLLDGFELPFAFSLLTLAEQPQSIIDEVARLVEAHVAKRARISAN